MKDKTSIIISHRISTVKDADNIIVLDNGKIVGMGKHEQLMKDCKVYREIADSQLSDKELKNL
jgi:ATP-binding cassette subfamily B protein